MRRRRSSPTLPTSAGRSGGARPARQAVSQRNLWRPSAVAWAAVSRRGGHVGRPIARHPGSGVAVWAVLALCLIRCAIITRRANAPGSVSSPVRSSVVAYVTRRSTGWRRKPASAGRQCRMHFANRQLGHLNVIERPMPGRKHQTNLITIASPQWRTWIARAPSAHRPIGFKSVKMVSTTKNTDLRKKEACQRNPCTSAPIRNGVGYGRDGAQKRAPAKCRGQYNAACCYDTQRATHPRVVHSRP